jgi:hypothetical protein
MAEQPSEQALLVAEATAVAAVVAASDFSATFNFSTSASGFSATFDFAAASAFSSAARFAMEASML